MPADPDSMTEQIPFSVPDIGEEEIAEVVEALRSGWITTGPRTRAFEAAFAEYVGAKCAVALNSCTSALHLALESIGIRSGDEVVLPTVTFAATGEVVRHLGARPVLVDVLAEVADSDGPQHAMGLLRIYERWIRTRSPRDEALLRKRGIIPLAVSSPSVLH